MTPRRILITAFLAIASRPAFAHDEASRGDNGGVIGDLGDRHIEVLARDGEIRIWLLDAQNKAVPAIGASGSLIVLAQGQQRTIRLEVGDAGAYLVGHGDFRAAPGMRVVVSLTLPGQPPRQARFTPAD